MYSIIIPVYNTPEDYLRKCINSLTCKELNDYEILLVDDGSEEKTYLLCEELAKTNEKIKIIHQKNQGSAKARNTGIQNSTGDYIIFVDADDYLVDGFMDKLNENILNSTKYNFDILLFKYCKNSLAKDILSNEITKINDISDFIKTIIIGKDSLNHISIGTPWGKIFKREFINKYNILFDVSLRKSQDKVFLLECYSKDPEVYLYDCYGYIYNQNDNSICNKYNKNAITFYNNLEIAYKKFIENYNREDLTIFYLAARILFLYELCIMYFCHKDNPNNLKCKKQEFYQYYTQNDFKSILLGVNSKLLKSNVRFFYYLLFSKSYFLINLYFSSLLFIKKLRKIFLRFY